MRAVLVRPLVVVAGLPRPGVVWVRVAVTARGPDLVDVDVLAVGGAVRQSA